MKNYEFENLKRVNKTTARKHFYNGDKIRICMCRVNPTNDFYQLYCDFKNHDPKGNVIKFDDLVNAYEFYNGCYELGYYAAYYIVEQ